MAPKPAAPRFKLPPSVTGPVEVGRLLRELEAVDEAVLQDSLRKNKTVKIAPTSQQLDATLELNKYDLAVKADRQRMLKYLQAIKQKAPVVHMSFAADPSAEFTERIVDWFRSEIHPFTLLTLGLQPNIGVGCTLRTINKFFDMSIRENLLSKKEVLIKRINAKAEVTR